MAVCNAPSLLLEERHFLATARPDVGRDGEPGTSGVEIASDVADGPYSVILDQVSRGVAVRMGVLLLLAGHKGGDGA